MPFDAMCTWATRRFLRHFPAKSVEAFATPAILTPASPEASQGCQAYPLRHGKPVKRLQACPPRRWNSMQHPHVDPTRRRIGLQPLQEASKRRAPWDVNRHLATSGS
jgi:hypothetical protein